MSKYDDKHLETVRITATFARLYAFFDQYIQLSKHT